MNALFLNDFESDTIISIHREFLLSSVLEISLLLNGRNFLSINRTHLTVLLQTSPKQFRLSHNLTTSDPPLFGFGGKRWGSAENRKVLDYAIRSWCMQQRMADSGTCSKQRHRCTGKGQTITQVSRSRWNIDTGEGPTPSDWEVPVEVINGQSFTDTVFS